MLYLNYVYKYDEILMKITAIVTKKYNEFPRLSIILIFLITFSCKGFIYVINI